MHRIIILFTAVLLVVNAWAHPGADSVSIARTKAKMDSIRQHRPTVALVLAGGGARGAVHTATIRYMEELGIPIDMVVGTSIGGLVAGMYAVGYTVDDIDSVFRNMDWTWVMRDRVERRFTPYFDAEYRDRYQLSIPFYEEKNDEADSFRKRLRNSLPPGYIYGQNVDALLSTITAGFHDEMAFSDLPIPYFSVAADVVSGNTKNWYSGKIFDAMRSTMAIPLVFAPVRVDDMVLVDGGVRDNYPTSLAHELGADIIIGVDISAEEHTADDIRNFGNIMGQTMFLLHQEAFEKNVKMADVTVRPDLTGYSMMAFDTRSIDSIIVRGEAAALAQDSAFRAIARLMEAADGPAVKPRAEKALDFFSDSILISGIRVEGLPEHEAEIIVSELNFKAGEKITKEQLDYEIAMLYGSRVYDIVRYELAGSGEPFELVLEFEKAPIHHVGLGLRVDTEEVVSLLLNVGLNRHRLYGHFLELEGEISVNPAFNVHWAYDSPKFLTLNATANVEWTNLNVFNVRNDFLNFRYLSTKQEFYLSKRNLRALDFKLGFRNEYFHIKDFRYADHTGQTVNVERKYLRNDYVSLFFDLDYDNMDRGYFPKRGVKTGVSYSWVFKGYPHNFDDFHIVAADVKGVVPLGKRVALIPSASCRFLLGDDIPVPYLNVVGGSLAGRYLDQQMPFLGLSQTASVKNILTIYRLDLRVNIAKKHYLTGIVNYMRDSDSFAEYIQGPGHFGAALEYSYDSIIGPLTANVHWCNITNKVGIYLSVGFDF